MGFIIELIVASLFITGLYTLCSYEPHAWFHVKKDDELDVHPNKMPLWFLSYYSRKWIGEFWSKPLFTCNVCMSSFWGMVFYWIVPSTYATQIGVFTVIHCIIFIIALTGINRLIYEKYLG